MLHRRVTHKYAFLVGDTAMPPAWQCCKLFYELSTASVLCYRDRGAVGNWQAELVSNSIE